MSPSSSLWPAMVIIFRLSSFSRIRAQISGGSKAVSFARAFEPPVTPEPLRKADVESWPDFCVACVACVANRVITGLRWSIVRRSLRRTTAACVAASAGSLDGFRGACATGDLELSYFLDHDETARSTSCLSREFDLDSYASKKSSRASEIARECFGILGKIATAHVLASERRD